MVEFLGQIALRYGATVAEIAAASDIPNPDVVAVGQPLVIPYHTTRTDPVEVLVPDSEVVYGPAYNDFNVAAFLATQPGYLTSYTTPAVGGGVWTGADLVQRIGEHYSVGPRILLALIEARAAG